MERLVGCGALLAALCGACGVGLSSNQPAHVPEKGHAHAELGVDVSYPTGTIPDVIHAAESVEKATEERAVSNDEKRKIFEGAAAIAINPPAAVAHAGFDYGVLTGWEVGVRLATSGLRASVRTQLLKQAEAGVDLSVGLGLGRALFTPPVHSVFDSVTVDDFSRWNVDLPVALGRHGSWYRVWGGPRLLWSHVSQTMTLTLQDFGTPQPIRTTGTVSGRALYVGGYAGAALGYRSFFVGPELTVTYLLGSADVDAFGGHDRVSVGSWVVYPAFAVMGEL
ncbi:MAG: hypothetical protein ABUL60_30655 [Myxococcales bacterium]